MNKKHYFVKSSLMGVMLFVSGAILSTSSYAATYTVDKDHTSVSFKIKHLFSWVQGNFNNFDGSVGFDGDLTSFTASGTIQADSIDTNVKERDKHLRSADFFDVEKFPTITFESISSEKINSTMSKLKGKLTIHGVTREVIFDLEYLGEANDPWGNKIAGFQLNAVINRKDFGLGWNQVVETGGVLVGEEVHITIDLSLMG